MGRRTAFLGIAGTSGGRLRSFPNGVQLEGTRRPPDAVGQRRAGRCRAAAASQSSVPAGRPVALRQPAKFLDQPYIVMSAGGFGVPTSAAVAGVVAGRAKNRRARWY